MSKKRSIPMTVLMLAKSGYEPLSGSNVNEHGLNYFMRHKATGKIICLNGDNKTYRPMGELQRINFQ